MTNVFEVGQVDIYQRFLSQLPPWFGDRSYGDGSVLSTVVEAYVYTAFEAYIQYVYLFPNMRLKTMFDIDFITLFAQDFFYNTFPQLANEPDQTYQLQIEANILRLRATRDAMANRIFELTGYEPIIFEPWYSPITGVYGGASSDVYTLAYADPSTPGSGLGYYGSGSYPYQCFITVFLDAPQFMGNYPGYSGTSISYPQSLIGCYSGVGNTNYVMQYGDDSLIGASIGLQQIYNLINITKVFGTICWVRLEYINPGPMLEIFDWVTDTGAQMITNTGAPLIFNSFQ